MKQVSYRPFLLWMFFSVCPVVVLGQRDSLTIEAAIGISLDKSLHNDVNKIQEELNGRQYLSILHGTAPNFSLSVSGPSYSHSLSPITQPDGSIQYHDVNSLNIPFSMSYSVPILLTGGNISLESDFNYYENKNTGYGSENFSANFYRLNLSQPLNFFPSYKWQRKAAKANLNAQQLKAIAQSVSLKRDIAKLFFNILSLKSGIDMYRYEKESLGKMVIKYDELLKSNKILETDVQEMKIELVDLENKIRSSEAELVTQKNQLNVYLRDVLDINNINIVCPSLLTLLIDDSTAVNYLRKKQRILDAATEIASKESIAQAKSQRGISASLNAGVGMNASSNRISALFVSKLSNQNASVSLTVPISDWKEQKNQYKIAMLTYRQNEENMEISDRDEELELKDCLQKFREDGYKYEYVLKKADLVKTEVTMKENLLDEHQILFDELAKTMDKYYQARNDIIGTLADSYDLYYQIEYLTLYDFIDKKEITGF